MKVPHMGWNSVELAGKSRYMDGVPSGSHFYFIHTYYPVPDDMVDVVRRPRAVVLVLGDELLRDGVPRDGRVRDSLGPLLPGWLIPALGLYMITPPSPLRPLRVRLLMQHLADGLKPARQ